MEISAHHEGLGQDVFYEFEVVALELLALGAGPLGLLVRVETEELRVVLELALLQDCRTQRERQTCEEQLQETKAGLVPRGYASMGHVRRVVVVLMRGARSS